jgi:hypothetical protein
MPNDPIDDAHERARWVPLTTLASGLEADIVTAALEAEGIPVLRESRAPGVFGLAFQGGVPGGVALQVPSPELARAQALLDELDGDDAGDDPAADDAEHDATP